MLYDLSKPLERDRFKRRADKLTADGVIVELTERRNRSLSQNNYLHLIIAYFAMETGNSPSYVKDQYFKRLCNRDLFVRQVTDPYCGTVETVRSSAELNKEEMAIAIDRFRNWSSETAGIYLPEADEKEYLEEIAVERSKVREWMY